MSLPLLCQRNLSLVIGHRSLVYLSFVICPFQSRRLRLA